MTVKAAYRTIGEKMMTAPVGVSPKTEASLDWASSAKAAAVGHRPHSPEPITAEVESRAACSVSSCESTPTLGRSERWLD